MTQLDLGYWRVYKSHYVHTNFTALSDTQAKCQWPIDDTNRSPVKRTQHRRNWYFANRPFRKKWSFRWTVERNGAEKYTEEVHAGCESSIRASKIIAKCRFELWGWISDTRPAGPWNSCHGLDRWFCLPAFERKSNTSGTCRMGKVFQSFEGNKCTMLAYWQYETVESHAASSLQRAHVTPTQNRNKPFHRQERRCCQQLQNPKNLRIKGMYACGGSNTHTRSTSKIAG